MARKKNRITVNTQQAQIKAHRAAGLKYLSVPVPDLARLPTEGAYIEVQLRLPGEMPYVQRYAVRHRRLELVEDHEGHSAAVRTAPPADLPIEIMDIMGHPTGYRSRQKNVENLITIYRALAHPTEADDDPADGELEAMRQLAQQHGAA